MEKTDARKLKPEVQQELRKQAIRLRKTGMKQEQIAEIIGVYPTTVSKWCRAYKKEGFKAIRVKKRGRPTGTCRSLTAEQEKQIQKAIVDKNPDQLKLPFALWIRIAVQQLIKHLYLVEMLIRTVGEYLKRWGYIF
jgi:transposase